MADNLCRCGTYLRIRQGIKKAAALMAMRRCADMSAVLLTRRTFLKVTVAAGGGMLHRLPHPGSAVRVRSSRSPGPSLPQGAEINAWLAIDAAGNVTIRVPHTEQGQGALTSVAMMIAEELDVHWARVRAVFADANRHLRNGKEYVTMFTRWLRRRAPPASAHHAGRRLGARAPEGSCGAAPGASIAAAVDAKLGALTSGTHTGTYAEFATSRRGDHACPRSRRSRRPTTGGCSASRLKRLDVDVKVERQRRVRDRRARARHGVRRRQGLPRALGRPPRASTSTRSRNRPGIIAAVEFKARAGQVPRSPTCRTPSPSSPTAGIAPRRRSISCRSNGTTARPRTSAPSRSSPRRGGCIGSAGEVVEEGRRRRSPCSLAGEEGRHGRVLPALRNPRAHGADQRDGQRHRPIASMSGRRPRISPTRSSSPPSRRASIRESLRPHRVPRRRLRRQRRRRNRP